MPSASKMKAQIGAVIDIFQEIYRFGSVTSPNLVGLIDTLVQAYEGDHVPEISPLVSKIRSSIGTTISPSYVASILGPMFISYARVLGFRVNNAVEAIASIYYYYAENAEDVNGRAFSFGSPSADGGNVGTGLLRRLSVDSRNMPIEIGIADSFSAECDKDQGSGTDIHKEEFTVWTGSASIDGLERSGSNSSGRLVGLCADDSLLTNASFSSGITAETVTGWEAFAGAFSTTTKDTTNYYRSANKSDSAPAALNLAATISIRQYMNTVRWGYNPLVPYYMQIAYNRQVGSGSGTLVIRNGAANTSVAVSAQTGWNILFIPLTAANCFWRGFKENNLDVTIEWTRTAGDLLIDDVLLVPMSVIRGQWYALIGGATPFLQGDLFTWADTIAADSVIQYWIQYAFGMYLPSVADGSETWADP
jgi:hypothetical protein